MQLLLVAMLALAGFCSTYAVRIELVDCDKVYREVSYVYFVSLLLDMKDVVVNF